MWPQQRCSNPNMLSSTLTWTRASAHNQGGSLNPFDGCSLAMPLQRHAAKGHRSINVRGRYSTVFRFKSPCRMKAPGPWLSDCLAAPRPRRQHTTKRAARRRTAALVAQGPPPAAVGPARACPHWKAHCGHALFSMSAGMRLSRNALSINERCLRCQPGQVGSISGPEACRCSGKGQYRKCIPHFGNSLGVCH